jgi:hypothetical protein
MRGGLALRRFFSAGSASSFIGGQAASLIGFDLLPKTRISFTPILKGGRSPVAITLRTCL